MALTYQQAVEQTIIGAEQFHEIINGSATSEIVVEDGSKIPSVRKALIDNFYYKDPIDWQQGQSELVFNQIRKFTDGTWWIAPNATATNPIVMGVTPYGDPLWKVFSWDRVIDSQKANRKLIERSWAEAGYNVVVGSFQEGATLNTATDVVIDYGQGLAVFIYSGSLPKIIPANSTPLTDSNFVNIVDTLRSKLEDEVLRLRNGVLTLRDLYSVRDGVGVVGDGITDDTVAIQAFLDSVPSGSTILWEGNFLFGQVIIEKPLTFIGNATITHNGFRVKTSNFTSKLTGKQICRTYQSSSRAFFMRAYEDGLDYSTINILFNNFSGFFYSTDLRGREYSASPTDPANKLVKGTTILGCTSIAPSGGVPAGHFQHTGITNAKCIGCSTYGGVNAASYNFINGNGFILVQGCYDQNNTYGSLEVENNLVSNAVVSGNVFGKQLWIDDTSNVSVTGNAVADRIFITAQSNDTNNITISGNSCSRISISKFGTSPIGRHKSVSVKSNTTYGEVGSNDLFADDSVDGLTVEANDFNGSGSSAVAVVRSANCDHMVRNNRSRTVRPLTISGTGGRVIEYGNDKMTVSGSSDSKHLSNMMVPSVAYLDLPGKYLHGTKYTGNLAPSGSAEVSLPIPDSGSLAFRGISMWVLIRDTATNNISSYRVDGTYRVVGATIALSFATAYSTLGVDFTAVTVANNASTSSSINILLTNTSGTKTFQVTIMPEVSSRLGTEE